MVEMGVGRLAVATGQARLAPIREESTLAAEGITREGRHKHTHGTQLAPATRMSDIYIRYSLVDVHNTEEYEGISSKEAAQPSFPPLAAP